MLHLLNTFAAVGSNCKPGTKGVSLLPPWYKYLEGKMDESGHCSLGQTFTFPDDLGAIGLAVVEMLLRVGAYVAIGYVIYGGILYMTSQGEPDKAKAAQKTIVNAIIGLVIAIIATGVVSFIGGQLI